MKVLVIGSGGREHALCWKISQSDRAREVFCAPGNAGISEIAALVNIAADDIDGLLNFAKDKRIGLVVVGPEAPLSAGIVDVFEKEGLRIFGPGRKAARLEASKSFAKNAMKKWNVPTADFCVFDDFSEAREYARKKPGPVVVKADGLAAGKGVMVCRDNEEAVRALEDIMVARKFGANGDRVVVEECLEGEEASIIVISDGKSVVPLATSQDHKAVYDGDKGANTGGMGAYSPTPVITAQLEKRIMDGMIMPMIRGMSAEGVPYKGALYAGIMLTKEGPKALEFNVRFGDPETQAVLPRLKSDLVGLMEGSIDGNLGSCTAEWDERSCVCVVVASGGYPGDYEKGKEIKGLDKAGKIKDSVVFHAGTKKLSSRYITDGGRVLGVTGMGGTIAEAIKKAYDAVSVIEFENMHFRRDIGKKALTIR